MVYTLNITNSMKKKFTISSDVYPFPLTIHIGYEHEYDFPCKTAHFHIEEDGFHRSEIYLEDFDWVCADMATLTHEMLHYVQAVMETTSIDDNEASAYLLECMMKKAYKKLAPKKK